jgi:hypothetical protein
MLWCRPIELGIRPENCRIEPQSQRIGTTDTVLMTDSGGLGRELWLDPARDFVVVRCNENFDVLGVRTVNELDISYTQSPPNEWVPLGWTTVFRDNYGNAEQYSRSIVTEASLNQAAAGRQFQADFPAATWVWDERTNVRYIVGGEGKTRSVTDDELRRGATYEELLRTKSGRAGLTSAAWRRLSSVWGLWIAIAAVLATAISVWALRMKIGRSESVSAVRT